MPYIEEVQDFTGRTLTTRHLAEIHWLLYLQYGNHWDGWIPFREFCGERWDEVVELSGQVGRGSHRSSLEDDSD